MAQEARAGVAGGARAAALADSIPSRGPRGAHAARPGAAGGPVRLKAAGRPVRLRAEGGPAPASLAAGGGTFAAHTPPHLDGRRPAQGCEVIHGEDIHTGFNQFYQEPWLPC
ncbi:uncharacterized protein ACIGJ3_015720 [Trichechus inunguis]